MEALFIVLGSGAFVGIISWALQLGTRISVVESRWEDLEEFLNRLLDSKFDDVSRRLERIERSMNGHFKDLD